MTETIFFDTDCLSAFLWVRNENLIVQLYPGRVMLPQQVYDEIKKVPPLKQRVDNMISNGTISLSSIVAGTPESNLYIKLTTTPDLGFKIIGRGEASAIVLTKFNNGILGSNNLADILPYVNLFKLKYITTANILVDALNNGLITETQGNAIWHGMLSKQRKLPSATFSDYLTNLKK